MSIIGSENSQRRKLYEPDKPERIRQYVVSKKKALLVLSSIVLFIFFISLIAAFARPRVSLCIEDDKPVNPSIIPHKQTFIATDGSPFPWKNIRLPRTTAPLSYTIRMHPNMETFDFEGKVDIILEVSEKQNFLVVHSKHLDVKDYSLKETNSGNEIRIKKMLEYVPHEQLYFELDSELQINKNYTLSIDFQAKLSSSLTGFYQTNYTSSTGTKRSVKIKYMKIFFCCQRCGRNRIT